MLQVGKEEVNITDMKPIGQYALKIFFDDKHKSGLFTWNYLYDLGQNYESHWADYLRRLDEPGTSERMLVTQPEASFLIDEKYCDQTASTP